jgi:hypothetical protein
MDPEWGLYPNSFSFVNSGINESTEFFWSNFKRFNDSDENLEGGSISQAT